MHSLGFCFLQALMTRQKTTQKLKTLKQKVGKKVDHHRKLYQQLQQQQQRKVQWEMLGEQQLENIASHRHTEIHHHHQQQQQEGQWQVLGEQQQRKMSSQKHRAQLSTPVLKELKMSSMYLKHSWRSGGGSSRIRAFRQQALIAPLPVKRSFNLMHISRLV